MWTASLSPSSSPTQTSPTASRRPLLSALCSVCVVVLGGFFGRFLLRFTPTLQSKVAPPVGKRESVPPSPLTRARQIGPASKSYFF